MLGKLLVNGAEEKKLEGNRMVILKERERKELTSYMIILSIEKNIKIYYLPLKKLHNLLDSIAIQRGVVRAGYSALCSIPKALLLILIKNVLYNTAS